MQYTIEMAGKTMTMVWRPVGRKPYTGTLCSFLYNLPRSERGSVKITVEGREVNVAKACAAATEEMNAVRNGRRVPAEPTF